MSDEPHAPSVTLFDLFMLADDDDAFDESSESAEARERVAAMQADTVGVQIPRALDRLLRARVRFDEADSVDELVTRILAADTVSRMLEALCREGLAQIERGETHSADEVRARILGAGTERRPERRAPDLSSLRARRDKLLSIGARFGASNVQICGAVARGEPVGTTAIEMVVDLESGRSFFDLVALQDAWSGAMRWPVHVRTRRGLEDRAQTRLASDPVLL